MPLSVLISIKDKVLQLISDKISQNPEAGITQPIDTNEIDGFAEFPIIIRLMLERHLNGKCLTKDDKTSIIIHHLQSMSPSEWEYMLRTMKAVFDGKNAKWDLSDEEREKYMTQNSAFCACADGMLKLFSACSADMQQLIIEHHYVFFRCDSLFSRYGEAPVSTLRRLNKANRDKILSRLESIGAIRYTAGENEDILDELSRYLKIISFTAKRNTSSSFAMPSDDLSAAFDKLIYRYALASPSCLEELKHKLSFSAEEWYSWMRFVIYEYKSGSVEELLKEMQELLQEQDK